MVGGYVMISLPAILGEPSFESGTKLPGLYDKLEKAMATGKLPVCQLDGPFRAVTVAAPFVGLLSKMTNGDFTITAFDKIYSVNSSDIVAKD